MIVLAVWSLVTGWHRHRKAKPVTLAVIGISLLLGSLTAGESYELYFASIASLFLIAAHLWNLKLAKVRPNSLFRFN